MRDAPGTPTGTLPDHSFQTDVPARLDRLPWSRFHWRVVIALGITWILDGLEVTLVGSLAAAIHQSPSLALTETQIGLTASAYLDHPRGGNRRKWTKSPLSRYSISSGEEARPRTGLRCGNLPKREITSRWPRAWPTECR